MSSTTDHPDVHAASAPEAVPAKLVLLWLSVLGPLSFRQAMVAVWETTDPIRVAALAANMFFTGAAYRLNSLCQRRFHR